MRKQFFQYLGELAEKDKNIIFLTGDLGFGYFESFRDKFPNQFINCGCIEQSMVGIAAGLARSGKKPYVYSTSPFLVFRALEQIRNDIAYQNLNVKFIGVSHSGFLGFSHQLLGQENEDDILKNLPNIKYYSPITAIELEGVMKESYKSKEPAYIKL